MDYMELISYNSITQNTRPVYYTMAFIYECPCLHVVSHLICDEVLKSLNPIDLRSSSLGWMGW